MKILTIHPINEDLRFLKKIKSKLKMKYPKIVSTKTLSNNYSSHEQAIREIELLKENDLIIFLCHGITRAIQGSKYRLASGSHPKLYDYSEKNGNLIDRTNINLFRGKKIFCLSCDSDTLGKISLDAGVNVFVGFSTIDFDDRTLLLPKQNPRHYVIAKTKFALRSAVYNSLIHSLNNNLSFYELVEVIKIYLNKEADNLILNNKHKSGFKYYKISADCILSIKEGIKIFGNGYIKILD